MYWTTCSSPSTKRGQRHLEKDKNRNFQVRLASSRFHTLQLAAAAILAIWLCSFSSAVSAATSKPENENKQTAAFLPFGVFGSLEFKTNATKGLGEWQRLKTELRSEEKLFADCDSAASRCPSHIRKWRIALKSWSTVNEMAQLERVNAWVNQTIHYTEDTSTFGSVDYWASPLQSLKGRGDCEDYAIAKYASLKALGYSEHRLRIVVVNDIRRRIGHAILSVTTSQGIYILDNQNARPRLHQEISNYAPVYSINASGRWINIATRQIKSLYEIASEKDGDAALAHEPVKSIEAARNSTAVSSDAEPPLELPLHPTTAAGELKPITFIRQDTAHSTRDWAWELRWPMRAHRGLFH